MMQFLRRNWFFTLFVTVLVSLPLVPRFFLFYFLPGIPALTSPCLKIRPTGPRCCLFAAMNCTINAVISYTVTAKSAISFLLFMSHVVFMSLVSSTEVGILLIFHNSSSDICSGNTLKKPPQNKPIDKNTAKLRNMAAIFVLGENNTHCTNNEVFH